MSLIVAVVEWFVVVAMGDESSARIGRADEVNDSATGLVGESWLEFIVAGTGGVCIFIEC